MTLYEVLKVKAMGVGATNDMFAALFASENNPSTLDYLYDSEDYILQDSEGYDLVVV